MQDIDSHWSNLYDQGRDYLLASHQAISKYLERVDPSAPKAVLDIGCGTGQLTRELYHRGYKVIGIDVSASAVKLARSFSVVTPNKLDYLRFDIEQGDLSKLPLAPYGLITCKLVYAFIKDRPNFLQKISQELAPNGTFIIITPLPDDAPDKLAITVPYQRTMDELSAVFADVKSFREQGITYFVGKHRRG
ncbi:MAG TPA: class I SAM-dependent methyltransferase [Patescibacteria group bacterium]|jgi:SAM-dependent methyltransferase|nr:class I SAM-dependent methyltransferase [Patescibacteria group bacterium]